MSNKKVGILAYGFGTPSTIRSNQRIAYLASLKAREFNAPVYTQLDVQVDAGISVTYTKEKKGDPPPTLRIARGAVEWAMENDITELHIVAAEPHLWRCVHDTVYAVKEAGMRIEVTVNEHIKGHRSGYWFCLESTQPRVRTWFSWIKREWILKSMLMTPVIGRRLYNKIGS